MHAPLNLIQKETSSEVFFVRPISAGEAALHRPGRRGRERGGMTQCL